MTAKAVLIIGAGGHAKVVAEALRALGRTVVGCTDADATLHGTSVHGAPVLGGDEILDTYGPGAVELALGLGVPRTDVAPRRLALARSLAGKGYAFPAVVHPAAVVAEGVEIGPGAQVMAGAVVQPATRLGDFSIVNTRASIDHDGDIGAGAHVAPGATLGGAVTVGAGALVGLGASVLPNLSIGAGATVAAGAAVDRPVTDNACVKGVPAR